MQTAPTASFTSLYEAHADTVLSYVNRRCRDRSLAEDITQDVFVAAVMTFDDADPIGTRWLLRVARNRLVDLWRRDQCRAAKYQLLRNGYTEGGSEGATLDRLTVEAALERLPADHRLVLTRHYCEGQSVAEIAMETGRSNKSIEGLITRARRSMRGEVHHDR